MVGLFSPIGNAQAQTTESTDPSGVCEIFTKGPPPIQIESSKTKQSVCTNKGKDPKNKDNIVTFKADNSNQTNDVNAKSELERQVNAASCGVADFGAGCFLKIAYYGVYQVSALILSIAANFFDFIISVSVNGELLRAPFIATAWTVVRDLSNIFFILILLYVGIRMIMGLGGHDVKKTIVTVILMALLINFSMFFTKIVIDTSNILALVFYNKLDTKVTGPDGKEIPHKPLSNNPNEKGLSVSMVNSFDPTKMIRPEFFEQAKKDLQSDSIPLGLLTGVTLISSAIILFAAYAFFVSGISFLGRIIELFILIIFSPFAFMSSTIPLLDHLEYVGWSAWFQRLLSVSFMAPIFMFFMYFIFLLINANLFNNLIAK